MFNKFCAKVTGKAGEHWTKELLEKLPSNKYIVLNNVFFMVNGIYYQIDHLVISAFGIFVIETKQYNGFITGGKYDKYWVRHTRGHKKYYYLNPIRQNYGHVKGLAELLHISESKIFNIVCIPSDADLMVEHDGEVTRYGSLLSGIVSHKKIIIDNVLDILKIINRYRIEDKATEKMYYGIIRSDIADKSKHNCPKCGGELVKRTGKYGSFIGCSNYPKCSYVRKKY